MRQRMYLTGSSGEKSTNFEVKKRFDFNRGVKNPMRDGVRLYASLYRPRVGKSAPVIFTLTPHIADSYHSRGVNFAQNGFIFAAIDSCERGNSEGRFGPLTNEPRDGHEIVEWLAAQPWYSGQVT